MKRGNNMANTTLATANVSVKAVTYKNGSYVSVKMGYNERAGYDRTLKAYASLGELGFTMKASSKGGYTVSVSGVYFHLVKGLNDEIVLDENRVNTNGWTTGSADFKTAKSEALHDLARKYLLNVQNFKTMKYSTLVNKFHNALIAAGYGVEKTEKTA